MRPNCLGFIAITVCAVVAAGVHAEPLEPPVPAPFAGIDTLCTNDWWNRPGSPICDVRAPRDEVIAFTLYTVSDGVLKLTAQLYPLMPDEPRTVALELLSDGQWRPVTQALVHDLGWSALFRIDQWDDSVDRRFRVTHPGGATYEGVVRKRVDAGASVSIAVLSCNSNGDRGPRDSYVRNINAQDPDLVFFAGDQSYDHTEHTAAWLRFGEQFREVFRNRPCVTIPDDHDIGQGNLWGEGGKKASTPNGDDGGYFYHPEYVRMVERCQTAHLPDPVDPAPIGQGIGVYFTRLRIGDADFAIVEDRKFKTGPLGRVPKLGKRVDVVVDAAYNPGDFDDPKLRLLGERQLAFLNAWAEDPAPIKVVLSQTGFAGAAHYSGNQDERVYLDLDSNGWPRTGRDRALRAIRRAGAVHLAGDQHLPTLIQHGIDRHRDGPWAFVSPAIVNNYWSRWWRPAGDAPGENRDPANPLPWTGDYEDGFGNKLTMHAYANPDARSRGAGYGLVRFDPVQQTATFECWPRGVDVTAVDAEQFPGWPQTVSLDPASSSAK